MLEINVRCCGDALVRLLARWWECPPFFYPILILYHHAQHHISLTKLISSPKLTVLPNHAAGPRAVVIHPQYAAVELAAVVGPIRFPVTALRTPFGTAIVLADEDVLRIELLQTGGVGVRIGRHVVRLALEVIAMPRSAGSIGLLALPSFEGQRAQGDQAGVDVDNDNQA